MIIRGVSFLLMGQLLLGSMLLPLGDFSALKELPRMYRAYEKVVAPDEKGALDFIGDYLLGGKDFLGHNKNDQPSKPGAMQFQHSGVFAILFHTTPGSYNISLFTVMQITAPLHPQGSISGYSSSLFRPPLA